MRKHFNRVKQIADQTFSRAERSELLTDDLLEVEQRIEFIKQTCSTTAKKLSTTLVSLRKSPEYQLGVTLNDMLNANVNKELDDDLLRNVISACTKLELNLAQVSQQLETDIELDIVQKLNLVVDKDLTNVAKLKTTLKKCILDMDSARSRYQAACRNSSANGNTKADSIKEELEEAETKVEQCRDTLATEMYYIIARECEIAQVIVDYVHMQKKQHEEALLHLNETLPQLNSLILVNPMKPMFCQPLEEHLALIGCKIAFPIELCTRALCQIGMDEEGLFRVTGGASKVKRLKTCLDAHCIKFEDALEYDAHVLAGVLKLYLRELPEPLLTYALYEDWLAAASELRLQALWSVLSKLPSANFDNLRYLVKFLAQLCDNKATNKMSSQNIAIVIGPNILWSNEERLLSDNIGINMNTASAYSVIVDSLVSYCDYFFPGPEEFYVTPTSTTSAPGDVMDTARTIMNGHSRASSADAGVIITDPNIARSQSNDSIQEPGSAGTTGGGASSGHNSDSPRPITRRKNKPAPGPPVAKSAAETTAPQDKASAGGKTSETGKCKEHTKSNDAKKETTTSGGVKDAGKEPPKSNEAKREPTSGGVDGKRDHSLATSSAGVKPTDKSEPGKTAKESFFFGGKPSQLSQIGGKSSESNRKFSDAKSSDRKFSDGKSEPTSPVVKFGGTVGGSDVQCEGSRVTVVTSEGAIRPGVCESVIPNERGINICERSSISEKGPSEKISINANEKDFTSDISIVNTNSDRIGKESDGNFGKVPGLGFTSDSAIPPRTGGIGATSGTEWSSKGGIGAPTGTELSSTSTRGIPTGTEFSSTVRIGAPAGTDLPSTGGLGARDHTKVMSKSVELVGGHGRNPFDESEEEEATSPSCGRKGRTADPSTRHNVENIYATYDRKVGPNRPTPAPRSFSIQPADDGLKKPAVPERPPVLARPLSSSFRIVRPGSMALDENKTSNFTKPHQPSSADPKPARPPTDCDTTHGAHSKPEKPPKPSDLSIPPSHSRSLSDGNTIDLTDGSPSGGRASGFPPGNFLSASREMVAGFGGDKTPSPATPHSPSLLTRACLPAPPLPPVSASERHGSSSSCSESTDL
ncbi:hypothetical protein M8J75_007853 [Diaphorina citri]|nr:hypothetical protein M8J75_007853 [Diaphorina citri]